MGEEGDGEVGAEGFPRLKNAIEGRAEAAMGSFRVSLDLGVITTSTGRNRFAVHRNRPYI